jgi:hypothetical protein
MILALDLTKRAISRAMSRDTAAGQSWWCEARLQVEAGRGDLGPGHGAQSLGRAQPSELSAVSGLGPSRESATEGSKKEAI